MAISFGESLKASKKVKIEDKIIAVDVPQAEYLSVDDNVKDISVYAEASETWTQVRNKGYEFYDDYNDDDYSVVDLQKNIVLNNSQINITQEANSQYIPFKMPRYYDGFDLTSTKLQFYYVNRVGYYGVDYPVNVYYNDEYIKFAWLVDSNATALDGKLKFEIQAVGLNSKGETYEWKSKTNEYINILPSLTGSKMIEPSDTWKEDFLSIINGRVTVATNAAESASASINTVRSYEQSAKTHADRAEQIVDELLDGISAEVDVAVESKLNTAIEEKLEDFNDRIDNIDGLANFDVKYDGSTMTFYNGETATHSIAITSDPTDEWVDQYTTIIDGKISTAGATMAKALEDHTSSNITEFDAVRKSVSDISNVLTNSYYKKDETYTRDEIDEKIENVEVDLSDYATEQYVARAVDAVSSEVGINKNDISSISKVIAEVQKEVSSVDKSPKYTYDVVYNDTEDENSGENVFVLYEITGEGTENESREIKKKFQITGGSGSGSSSSLKIHFVTMSPVVAPVSDKLLIKYNFSGVDSSGDIIPEASYTWKVNGRVIASGVAVNGENTFDATNFATTTEQTFILSITDDAGAVATKSWKVKQIDVRLESNFSDAYEQNGNISFSYTPYGDVEKKIHFVLDGEEIGVETTSISGIPMSYPIPAQSHGSHLLEVYLTAEVNGKTLGVEDIVDENGNVTGHNYTIKIVKDLLWRDQDSDIPVIGCATQLLNVVQYNTVNLKYVVIDPKTETPKVTWSVNGELLSEEILTEKDPYGYYLFNYKANTAGTFVLTISCGDAEPKVININVEQLNIPVSPVTDGLAFDFNPVGYSNGSADRLWSHNDISMSVSDNFDWVNGGYQIDEVGDQYFCVKAGTRAVINYNLFADDPKRNGKEFKVVFRTKNIRKRNTSFLSCLDKSIGLDMKVEHANVYNSNGVLRSDYCENEIIEYEFNINRSTDMMIVMSYEDGTPGKPCEYSEMSSFKQDDPRPITIGSDDCDVHIYRMKAYYNSLSDTSIKNNFIADARNADEIIARYNRNNIYNGDGKLVSTSASGDFSAAALMKAAPDLRYIFIEAPQFTNDKDNSIDNCTVYFRYPAGTRPQDNWTCTGVRHKGQGTSSNLYGYAGRNIDLCMDRDESLFTWNDIDSDGKPIIVESSTVTLTDTSVPTDYLNIKVNIASSENANNAQLAKRFNEYQPFLRYARKKDSKVKDTMEFYNCVVFIRETSTDVATTPHREFNDTNWHFYAIGNVGDSKKTDDTRVNNKRDPKEHIIEITDADKPLSAFPTGKNNHDVCPVSEWKPGNSAYDILYSNEYVYDEEGKFESFGGKTYEFRYEMKNITSEQRQSNIDTWRDLYKFVATSSDDEFYAHLKDYFVVDSALYFYLFTERYTMVDNRAKNSFWHYGKVYISDAEAAELGETEASYYILDNDAAAINDGYRYDLTMGYDMDTALGIDNTGDYVFAYGKEDTDYYVDGDPTSDYVFRVADSVFFCRLRDLFPSELQAMFKNREEKNAWNSTSLISQWDDSQALFPEELWRLDYERKYYRTYLGLSIDNSINTGDGRGIDKSFLIGKFFGRKKYARRSFEYNQEIYFATKYFGNKALSDVFWIRGNVPIGGNIKPNYSITLTPYSDMYLCVQYTSTGTPLHSTDNGKPKRVKAGEVYTFESTANRMDFIYVYAASYIQAVGDLSRCFVGDNNFSSATRLQSLVIGSNDDGYENTFMREILVANNPLLEHLDLRNISGINTVIDVSGCSNLKELYAEGTNASGIIFANGGIVKVAHLPSMVSMSIKNLSHLDDFSVAGYDKLQTLVVENTPRINTYEIVKSAPLLKLLRLIGMDWNFAPKIENMAIFNRMMSIGGIDSSGYEVDVSILSGSASVEVIGQHDLDKFKDVWPDLRIDPATIKPQFTVTFINYDGCVLDIQYINQFEDAVNPIDRDDNPIPTPEKPSTVKYAYLFDKWDSDYTNVRSDVVITATYTESIRNYIIHYVSNGTILNPDQEPAPYGSNITYDGIPTYTGQEPHVFYLFNRWDYSGFLENGIDENGVKTVNAIFDKFEYSADAFDGKKLEDLTPVQIYALTKLNDLGLVNIQNVFSDKGDLYSFTIGNDVQYDDIPSELLISEPVSFNGVDQQIDTGIKLFDEDRDFILAIDYEFLDGNATNSVLAQCYQTNGSNGFKLWYSNNSDFKGARLTWGGSSFDNVVEANKREVIVIQHKKGNNNLTIYKSNLDGDAVLTSELTRTKVTDGNGVLVFGCNRQDDGAYENHAIGKIYWSKIWYKDLGDDVCRSLATWTHENISFGSCGFKKYYLSDNTSKRCSFSLLANHLLSRTKKWNRTNINTGGWAASELNKSLNTRLYSAIPQQIRQLIKKVVIGSSDGQMSSDLSYSDCYITVPALVEVSPTHTTEPYNSEGKSIPYMTDNNSRKRAYDGGDYAAYWLRSPNVDSATWVWRVDQDGKVSGYSTANSNYGVLIEISF